LLKAGKNTIVIRAVGVQNKHHFIPGKTYELSYNASKIASSEAPPEKISIPLDGPWKRRIGCEMPPASPSLWHYNIPCCVYNYMLAPVLGYSIDGVIWYQGESNTGKPEVYVQLFEELVRHLRAHFGEEVPVIFTQLANYIDPNGTGENWAELREQQRQCLNIPNTAMAVAIDCGEHNDIHPLDKKTVGQRLALNAKRLVYGEDIVTSGPMVTKARCQDNELTIFFASATGLWVQNGRPMVEVIDSAGVTHRLTGKVEGETLVASIGDYTPVEVRFGWEDCPTVVLYNAYGLPASPFRICL